MKFFGLAALLALLAIAPNTRAAYSTSPAVL